MKTILLFLALFGSALAQITVTPSGGVNLAAPGPIGGTTPSTGAFTTLATGGQIQGVFRQDQYQTTGGYSNFSAIGLELGSGHTVSWNSSANFFSGNRDVVLRRAAAGVLKLGSATAGDNLELRINGLDTDASNYHYGSVAMSDTALTISTQTLGGGVDNLSIALTPSGTGTINVGSNGLYNSDGTKRLNQGLSVYAAGTAYTMTNSAAAMDFGTTDPTLVLDSPGTYLIFGRGLLKYNGATYAGTQTATIKLRRTNNTAADLTNATTTATLRVITTVTDTVGVMPLPPVIYTTANSDDSISVFGALSAAPSVGTVEATEASIVAVRLYQ